MKKGNSENDKSEKGQFWKGSLTLEGKGLNNINSGKEESEKGQCWTGQI